MLLKAYDLGMAEKQASAASQAAMGIAKLHGYLIEKHQVDAIVRRPSALPDGPDEMSEADWLEQFGGAALIEHDPGEGSDDYEGSDNKPS